MSEQLKVIPLEQGLAERESLREQRTRNYAIKEAAGWTCQQDGCSRNVGVVVVQTKGGPECRCIPHIGRLKVTPGQWYERSAI